MNMAGNTIEDAKSTGMVAGSTVAKDGGMRMAKNGQKERAEMTQGRHALRCFTSKSSVVMPNIKPENQSPPGSRLQ